MNTSKLGDEEHDHFKQVPLRSSSASAEDKKNSASGLLKNFKMTNFEASF